jgi:hypothetical protein
MTTEYTYRCDGCGADVTKSRYTAVELQEYDNRPEEARGRGFRTINTRTTWDLCLDCVKDVVAALKSKSKGVEE